MSLERPCNGILDSRIVCASMQTEFVLYRSILFIFLLFRHNDFFSFAHFSCVGARDHQSYFYMNEHFFRSMQTLAPSDCKMATGSNNNKRESHTKKT